MKLFLILVVFSASFLLLTISGKYLPDFVHKLNREGWDKLAHTIIFFVIELVCFYLLYPLLKIKISYKTTFLVLSLIGIFIEFIQWRTGREFSYLDMLANCIGVLLGILIKLIYEN
jgi:VanZ family protein